MKRITLICFILLLTSELSLATGQSSERIIYKGDTLELLSLPLEDYLGEYEERENKYPSLSLVCSTGLWRGYRGLWKLENNELFLIDVFLCADTSRSIIDQLFETKAPIKAEWYTGELFVQHGKRIKYHHSGFNRYFEEETVIQIR